MTSCELCQGVVVCAPQCVLQTYPRAGMVGNWRDAAAAPTSGVCIICGAEFKIIADGHNRPRETCSLACKSKKYAATMRSKYERKQQVRSV